MLKNVQMYVNNAKRNALELSMKVRQELISSGYKIIEDGVQIPDLVIGFGGDGTLLKWLSSRDYDTTAKYIGVNCGTLGFMQDFKVTDAKEFVSNIPNYVEQKLNFVYLELVTEEKISQFYALNEFDILSSEDKTFKTNVKVADEFLENFAGTGLIFCSPTGSTAHNISSIGSVMFPGVEAMQMTPSEAIVNRRLRCLPKSICVPKGISVTLTSINSDKIKIIADGKKIYDGEYIKIRIRYSNSYMIKLTDRKHSFVQTVKEKLI